jgi:hypothetical protein
MSKRAAIASLSAALVAVLALGPVGAIGAQTLANINNSAVSSQPPTDAELRARGAKLVINQHENDDVLDRYERIEHEIDTTGGPNARTLADRKTRLGPNGAGTTKILLEQDDRTVTPDEYRRELQNWVAVLQFMVNPNDSRMKSAAGKYGKKQQARTQLVDAMLTAFTRKWVGREKRNGRDCDVIELTPDPNFHPRSILEDALSHAFAKIWVDRDEDQLVRAEAHINKDIWVGGGVIGKLYKGGTFVMDQAEVSPGVWLPTHYQFDFSGREFLFSIERHESIDVTRYRYIGSPKDALIVAQSELASGKPLAGDP